MVAADPELVHGANFSKSKNVPIAVIGMACVFPGAPDVDAFWALLEQGQCAVKAVPPNRWNVSNLPESAARFAGFIDDADCFDPAFFGISPKEAAALDPRQRLSLQVAWQALEDAGIAPDGLRESRLGVFIGAVNGEFLGNFSRTDEVEPHMGGGASNAVIANRISHFFGVRGPSMSIDTACSSSLIAVHQACRCLQTGDADMVLAGGVSLMLRADSSVALGKGNMLAPDGLCKTFDASANGYGRGEGCGLVLLKRLDDAIAAGDRIHAVIRGSASNHDGVSNGITAPNGQAQEKLIQDALADAGMHPGDIQYVETHGTGTLLGDPTEARALGRTLGQSQRARPVLVGSVKTNIGHLEAAAGIAGLIKLILALKHKKLPASLHFSQANPHINFTQLGLSVVDQKQDWLPGNSGEVRVGSVSAFGFGGANCHVVVQESPKTNSPFGQERKSNAPQLFTLSAASSDALQLLAQRSLEKLRRDAESAFNFVAICVLSRQGRSPLRHRLNIVVRNMPELLVKLQAFLDGRHETDAVVGIAARRPPRIAFLCPGQGAQRAGMAAGLLTFPPFREVVEEADHILPWSMSQLLSSADAKIDLTAYTQPALLVVGVGLARLLATYGVRPQVLAGHSLGEYTAAVIAGGLNFSDALRLVALRGKLMSDLNSAGGMMAVRANEETLRPYLACFPELSIAAINGSQAITISGSSDSVQSLAKRLEVDGIKVRTLRVSTAFHSVLLEPILDAYRQALQSVQWRPLELPVCSNLTGELFPSQHVYDVEYWIRHTREAVQFAGNMKALGQAGVDTTIELGILPVLSGMVDDIVPQLRTLQGIGLGSDDCAGFLTTIAQLHASGAQLKFPHVAGQAAGDALPLYPFAKDVFPLRIGAESFFISDFGVELRKTPVSTESISRLNIEIADRNASVPQTIAEIRQRIIALIANLLAIDVEKIDASTPLLEIGADSLILMQAVGRIESEFGIKIPVRSFFENLSTIDAVAVFLAEKSLVARAESVADNSAPPPTTSNVPPVPARALPPKTSLTNNLSEQQRRNLDLFCTDYCARTALSKQHAQRYRHVLADSRASAGFRFSIKEMLYPIVGKRADGAKIWDIDGNEYVDISMGFGVQLFGHEPAFLKTALSESMSRGLRIGPQSDTAGEVAELISELTGVERVSFCSSGTEAIMTALRLARTATGRRKVAVFKDSYHGHFDGVLGDVGDDPWMVQPRVAGITPGMVSDLAFFEYGSEDALTQLSSRLGEFAAVLVEPVQSRNPGLQPAEFLRRLRQVTKAAGCLLIFDEVLVGFRIHPGGAQAYFDIKADLVTYGKIVGGGLPIGAISGRADIMAGIDGGLWQYGDMSFPAAETTFFAGTFNKHPLVMSAAKAVLGEIKQGGLDVYDKLNKNTERLTSELDKIFHAVGAPVHMKRFGSLFRFIFKENLDPFFYHLLYRGLYVWEGRNLFLSTAHTDADIQTIIDRVADSVEALRSGGFIQTMATVLPSANNGVETKALPLSPAQKQLAILAALTDQGSSAYIVSVAIDLQGNFDATAMETAFRRLVQRHDALRACVDIDADVQRIVTNLPFELRRHSVAPADLELALQNSVAQRFDLTRPGAFRVDLFEMDQTHAVLLFAAHHVFIDGQSVQILFEEFADLMKGQGLDQSSDYAKFATKMASAGKSNNDQAHREYWLQKLRGVPDGITLPFARARAPIRRFNGARVSCELNLPSLRRLELKARKRGMSSNMALIAAFSACLRRAGAGQDMVIGIPYSGRDAELEGIPGYCAHLLPLRLNIPAQASTDFVLEEVKQVFLDAIAHANYPLSLLVDDLNLAKDPSRPALVNMTFNVDKLAAVPDFPGMKAQPVSLPIRHARFDLGCNLIDWNDGASIEMDYDSDLYDAKDVKELLCSFVAMIERMSLADQAFDERLALRLPWHVSPPVETDTASPDLLARFRQAVAQNPLAIAAQLDAAEMMNRFQLQCHSDQLAHSLLNQITSDGPVVLLLGRTLAFPVAMLAAWKCGRAYLPLDAGLPVGRVLELLQQAHASCVILQESKGSLLTQLLCEALNERNISYVLLSEKFATSDLSNQERGNINAFQDRKNAPEDCAYQLFTSGSTGKPKLVSVPHRAVMHYLDAAIEAFGFSTGLRYAVVSTFAADLGLTAILPALFHSGTLLIVSNPVARDADAFAGLIQQFPIDVLKIVPSHMEALLVTRNRVLPVSHLILGGETASPQLLKLLHDCPHECRIFNHFGPTETTIGVMVGEWSGDTAGMRFTQPLGRNRILILDANGNLCAFNEPGEIYIGGPGLAIGYVGHERDQSGPFLYKNVGGFEERLYRTGDLAVLRDDGSIKLFGRSDEQIKIRGYRIEPAEIVDALTAQENVAQAVVFLYQPENRHAYLLAYVVPVYPESQRDSMELLSRLSKVLPEYMLPKEILFVDHLPFTANGKLDKAALPKPLATVNNVAQIEGEQQKTPQQMALISLWRELLRLEWIGLRHDFFQCGGDSILAIQMIARLRQSGWIAKASDIYDAPILMDFAEKLLPADAIFVSQKPAEGQCSLLPSQLRLRQMMGQTLPSHYNLSVRLALEHWVTPELLQKAIGKLVHEHDALRLCFDVASEKPDAHFVEAVVPPLLFLSDKENPLLELNQAQASLRPELAQLMVVVWQSRVEDATAGKAHVVLILHHLISDGVSIQILLDDLRQALLAMRAGRDPDFGYKTRTVQTWAEHLLRQSRQDALSEEAEYWTICTSIPAPELPGGIEMEPARMRDERQVYANLSVEETTLFLHGLPNAGAEDMLIAALVLSLSTLWAEPIAYLELEGHGRQITQSELDISRTVGWFTCRYPAWFDLSDVAIGDAAQSIAQQRREIPSGGVGYGLLRYLGPEQIQTSLAQGYMPEISLNYLGQIRPPDDDVFTLISWTPDAQDRGLERASDLPLTHQISVEAMILNGQLKVLWLFNGRRFQMPEMQGLANEMVGNIRMMLMTAESASVAQSKESLV